MDLEDGNKTSQVSDVVDGSGEIKQESETPLKELPNGSGETKQPLNVPDESEETKQTSKTPVNVPDKNEETRQPETPLKVVDESAKTKKLKTPPDESGETKKLKTPPDESGETKQSETPLKKVPDVSGDSKQSEAPKKVTDGSEKTKQSKTASKDSETAAPKVPNESGKIKQSEIAPKVPNESEETKQSVTPPKTHLKVPDGKKEIKVPETAPKLSDGETKLPETPTKVPDGTAEIKLAEKTTQEVSDRETKQSETPTNGDGGSEKNKQSKTPTKVNDEIKHPSSSSPPPLQSKVVEAATAKGDQQSAPSGTSSKDNDKSKANNKDTYSPPKVNDGIAVGKHSSSPPIQSKVIETSPARRGGHTREPSDRLLSFTSSSSSGSDRSDTSLDDLFQVDSSRFSTSTNIPPLPKDYGSRSTYRPSTSRLSNVTNELPTESPPAIQMMDRYGGYDPSRIPSSVFDTSNQINKEMEWSVASNDSLFSLHLGNGSFSSRDQVVMLNDVGGISPRIPPPIEETEIYNIEEGRDSASEELVDVNIKETERLSAENSNEAGKVPHLTIAAHKQSSLAFSHRSDGSGFSGASARSFAFPILTDGTKNSLKLTQESEHMEAPLANNMSKKKSRRKIRWFPCFSWCKGGCGISCPRCCGSTSCPRCWSWSWSCSCSSCFRRICCCC